MRFVKLRLDHFLCVYTRLIPQTPCSVRASLTDTRSVRAAVLYLGHKQGAGVDDVYEVSQTAEEGALQEATFKLRSLRFCLSKHDGTRKKTCDDRARATFHGETFLTAHC